MSQTAYGARIAVKPYRSARRTGAVLGGVLVAAFVLGGCAAGEHQVATHRWVALDQVSGVEYRVDNSRCARETLGETGPRVLKTNTEAYHAYVACMNDRGYVLTAYNENQEERQPQ